MKLFNAKLNLGKGISLTLMFGAVCMFSQFFVHTVISETSKTLYYQFVNSLPEEKVSFLLWSLNCRLNYAASLIIGLISGVFLFVSCIFLLIYIGKRKIKRGESSILILATYGVIFVVVSAIFDMHLLTNIIDPSLMIAFSAILSTMYYLHVHEFKTELSKVLDEIHSRRLKVKYLEMKDGFYKDLSRSTWAALVALFVGVIAVRLFQVSTPSPLIESTYEWGLQLGVWAIWIVELFVGGVAIELELLKRIHIVQDQVLRSG